MKFLVFARPRTGANCRLMVLLPCFNRQINGLMPVWQIGRWTMFTISRPEVVWELSMPIPMKRSVHPLSDVNQVFDLATKALGG